MLVIHLIRHGHVENPKNIIYGRLPGYYLSKIGKQSIEQVASFFLKVKQNSISSNKIAFIVSSPLERTLETAQIIGKICQLRVIKDNKLIEAKNYLEGLSLESKLSFFKIKYLKYYINPFKPSWGEPYKDQICRMLLSLSIAQNKAYKIDKNLTNIIVISHQLPILLIRSFFERRSIYSYIYKRSYCKTSSITSIYFKKNLLYKCTKVNYLDFCL